MTYPPNAPIPPPAPAAGPGAQVEETISTVLRLGVWSSLALLGLGTLLSFLQAGGYGTGPEAVRHLASPAAAFPRTASWLVHGLGRLEGRAIIVSGLLLLIATPVVRVAISILAFARQRDRTYVLLTSAVLVVLILSFILGRAG